MEESFGYLVLDCALEGQGKLRLNSGPTPELAHMLSKHSSSAYCAGRSFIISPHILSGDFMSDLTKEEIKSMKNRNSKLERHSAICPLT